MKRRTLHLALCKKYFDEIKAGTKPFEFRLATTYWRRRLEGREYDDIVITWGYPSRDDESRHLHRPWLGCELRTITHEHFGKAPVLLFAITVNMELK